MSVHRAIRVTGLASIVNLLLNVVSAVLVARWLTPGDIGIFSVAVSLTAFTHILREFGVGQYFLQLKDLTREHLRAGFTAMLITSWSLALLMAVAAAPVAAFYRQPGIGQVFWVLAANFMILPFGSHVLSQLKRDLQFDKLAWVSIINGVVQTAVTLVLAWRGHSYMSMAWGSLAGNLANVAALWFLRPDVAWLRPTHRHLRTIFGFGTTSSSASLLGQLGNSAPDLILGKTQSVVEVAQFSRANGLLGMLVARIDLILVQVFTPVFAHRLRDGHVAAPLLAQAIQLHSGVALPMIAALAVISGPLTLLMFGPQWQTAAQLAPWITGYAALLAPLTFAPHALVAGGHVRAMLSASLWSNGSLVLVLLSSAWLDLMQMTLLLLVARLVHGAAWLVELRRCYGFGPALLFKAVAPSLRLTVFVLLPMLAVLPFTLGLSLFTQVALHSALASVAFVVALRWSAHPLKAELPRLVPPLRHLLEPRTPRP